MFLSRERTHFDQEFEVEDFSFTNPDIVGYNSIQEALNDMDWFLNL